MPRHPAIAYEEDLAYVHDAGFGQLAEAAAGVLLARLARGGRSGGSRQHARADQRVVELGCGSGISAQRLCDAGYRVMGFDLSEAMLALARARVPEAEFRCESFVTARLPRAMAVTAIGEIFNYEFDPRNNWACLRSVWRKIFAALEPGGVLLFDLSEPGRAPAVVAGYREGDDWLCAYRAEERPQGVRLVRTIVTFRRVGPEGLWRRSDEEHRLRLYERAKVVAELRRVGFRVAVGRSYGEFALPKGMTVYLATKPAG